jgi:hypothetical protein
MSQVVLHPCTQSLIDVGCEEGQQISRQVRTCDLRVNLSKQRGEVITQLEAAAIEPALHRRNCDARDLRRFLHGQSFDIMQHDRFAVAHGQRTHRRGECRADLVGVGFDIRLSLRRHDRHRR